MTAAVRKLESLPIETTVLAGEVPSASRSR
jgi:hypothetical protein